jgi:hypothetical protein
MKKTFEPALVAHAADFIDHAQFALRMQVPIA